MEQLKPTNEQFEFRKRIRFAKNYIELVDTIIENNKVFIYCLPNFRYISVIPVALLFYKELKQALENKDHIVIPDMPQEVKKWIAENYFRLFNDEKRNVDAFWSVHYGTQTRPKADQLWILNTTITG